MLKIDDLIIDKEFEELLPVLTPEEFVRLEQSVLKNGMLDPIKVWEEPNTGRYIIIDGHNRYNILKKNNLGFKLIPSLCGRGVIKGEPCRVLPVRYI